jgi:hypothetical protein
MRLEPALLALFVLWLLAVPREPRSSLWNALGVHLERTTKTFRFCGLTIEGDFASNNPWFSFDAGPGGLVSGASGLVIGRFAWVTHPDDPDGTPSVANNTGFGNVSGFVHRAQQGLITTFLSFAGTTIPKGFQVGLMVGGDFWVKNNGTTAAQPGNKAYANFADGTAAFAATGSPATAATFNGSVAAATFVMTGSIGGANGDQLTVTAISSGTLQAGATLVGTGITTGTKIVSQVSGSINGTGVYLVSIAEQSVASTSITGTYGTLSVTSVASGTLAVGQQVTGTAGIVAGTSITGLGTGTGGTGTYLIDNSTTVANSPMTTALSVETAWMAVSSGLVGELVKISTAYGTGIAGGYVGFGTP